MYVLTYIHMFQLLTIFTFLDEHKDEIPCIDPCDTLFLTNKWDIIEDESTSSASSEDDSKKENGGSHERTWNFIQNRLKAIGHARFCVCANNINNVFEFILRVS